MSLIEAYLDTSASREAQGSAAADGSIVVSSSDGTQDDLNLASSKRTSSRM
jgi:hypothetical protein